jgi:hypothetical protein
MMYDSVLQEANEKNSGQRDEGRGQNKCEKSGPVIYCAL